MAALLETARKEIITREEATEMAIENYTGDSLQDDIIDRLENDDRVAGIRKEIEQLLLDEKYVELENLSDEDLLRKAGLPDEFEVRTDIEYPQWLITVKSMSEVELKAHREELWRERATILDEIADILGQQMKQRDQRIDDCRGSFASVQRRIEAATDLIRTYNLGERN